MRASQRRQEIIELLVEHGHLRAVDLAKVFGVTKRTILFDIADLSLTYPIYTVSGRVGGGIYISENYKPGNKYINDVEVSVLKEMLSKASPEQKTVLEGIIKKFSIKRRII